MIKGKIIIYLVLAEVLYVCLWLMDQFIELELVIQLLQQVDTEEHFNHAHPPIHALVMVVV